MTHREEVDCSVECRTSVAVGLLLKVFEVERAFGITEEEKKKKKAQQ